MSDLFKEVEEDLRREQYKRLWNKYGVYAIAAAVILVLTVGGLKGWEAWDLSRRAEQSDRYAAAVAQLEAGNADSALAALDTLAAPQSAGYGMLAALEQARLLAARGERDAAVALWDQVAGNAAAGPAFRGLATLLSALHRIDDGDPDTLRGHLQPLSEAGNPFRPLALELLAALALRLDETDVARGHLDEILTDPLTPPGLRARAEQVLTALDGSAG